MKKTIVFLSGLILAGILAYFTGYYVYISENPKTELPEPMTLQKAMPVTENAELSENAEYYIAIIEKNMLVIYKMPENTLYDSVEISSLHFTEKDETKLREGICLMDLKEVYEFLENSMS